MKRLMPVIVTFLYFLMAPVIFAAGTNADSILGEWYTEENRSIVEIYKQDSKFFGKITWLTEEEALEKDGTPKMDGNNPDPELAKKPIVGVVLAKDFEFSGKKWENGTIYDPENGKTYSCQMEMNKNKLKVRGYIGTPILGRTTYWVKK